MDKTIYFIRHGETEFNRLKIVQGSGVDSDLNESGRDQARKFYEYYHQDLNFDLIVTSALKRTSQTIEPFFNKNIPYESWAEINEINWGIHEGMESKPWMIKAYKKMVEQWSIGNFDASLQDGESARQLADRINHFLESIKTRPEKSILVCTHGRTLRCLMCLVKGQHLREMESYTHSNTGLFKVHWKKKKFIVEFENDTRHLNETENE
jgi:2,3-bisphosphoglycerate-dependent phosphoglycerate mutase